MGLLDLGILMGESLKLHNEVFLEQITESARGKSKLWYGVLLQVCRGRALSLVRSLSRRCGLLAWRRLVREYEPDSPVRHTAMLSSLLSPQFVLTEPFLDQLARFEYDVQRYEADSKSQPNQKMADAA